MSIVNTIKFRFTLWYLSVLSLLLVLLGGGVYYTLYVTLHRNFDDSLKIRAEQLANFKDIIPIIAGGTFEEEIGEFISFYFYADGELIHVSHKGHGIHVEKDLIDLAISGKCAFATVKYNGNEKLRIFASHYSPDNPFIRVGRFKKRAEDPHPGPDRFPRRTDDLHDRSEGLERTNDAHGVRRDRYPRVPDFHDGRGGRFPENPVEPRDKRDEFSEPEGKRSELEIHSAALMVARPTKGMDGALDRLLKILITSIPLAIVISGAGGVFLAKKAFDPVEQIIQTAQEIGEHDLSQRIEINTKDELGRLSTTLNHMIDKLERAFKRQKEFTGDASHELRAPLAIIRTEATLSLEKERDAEEYRKSLEVIAQESDQMSILINQLLTLARADTGQEQLVFKIIDLAEFLSDVCDDVAILFREKELTLQLGPFEQVSIHGDIRSIRSLIVNLLANAIRYTPSGGTITVGLRREGQLAVVTIRDTGIGIPTENLPYIFKRFYRVDKARSRNVGGSGLGLSICKQIVDIHKGKIEVESDVKKGSAFYVKLPVTMKG